MEISDYPEGGLTAFLQNETFRLILGVLTMVIGLLKLLSSFQGDLPILGDLVPALVGLGAGFILIFDYYRNRSSLNTEQADNFAQILDGKRKWIGYIAITSAILHFLFPRVLFL